MEHDKSPSQTSSESPWNSFAERTKQLFRRKTPEQKTSTPNSIEASKPPVASARAREYEANNPDLDFGAEVILILDDGYHYLHDHEDPAIADHYANSSRSESSRDFLAHLEQNERERKTHHRHQQKVLETLITGNINSLAGEPSPRAPQDYLAPLHQLANGTYSSIPHPFPGEPSFDSAAESSLLRKVKSPLDQNPTATWNRVTSDQFKSRLLARITRNPNNPRENFNPTLSQEDLLTFYSNHPTPVEAESMFYEALEFINNQDRTFGRAPNPNEPDFMDGVTQRMDSCRTLIHDLYGKRQEYHDAITELRHEIVTNSGGNPAKLHHQCENLAISFATPNR